MLSYLSSRHHIIKSIGLSSICRSREGRERGHPFMTSTRRREGVKLRRTHVDLQITRGPRKGPSIYDVHTEEGGGQAQEDARGCSIRTSTQKIRAHLHHPVFFSCKAAGIFLDQHFSSM